MTIIDGVGNEVTQFFFVLICGIVALLAWWSTSPRERLHRFRTAVILERNTPGIYRVIQQASDGTYTVTRRRRNPSNTFNMSELLEPQEIVETTTIRSTGEETMLTQLPNPAAQSEAPAPQDPVQSAEMNNIVGTMDSGTSVLRNRRLAFFSNILEPNTERQQSVESTTSDVEIDAPISENLKTTSNENVEQDNREEDSSQDQQNKDENQTDNIRIRLKYLNDDIKFVVGKLHEPLGEFKRRHFKGELSARKLVRLIFNGQVLKPEAATLQSCGLFDNCVVHCLVHQPRTPQQYTQAQQQLNPNSLPNNLSSLEGADVNQPSQLDADNQDDRDWDLNHVLFTLIASLLTVGWYIHVRFSGFFGIAASIAMLSLTVLYFIALIGVYFPEIQPRRNAQPAATTNGENAENNAAE